MLRITALTLTLGLALLAPACGGGDDAVSADELQAQISEAQDRANSELSQLGNADSADELQARAEDAAAALREEADSLADVDVPEGVEDARNQFVESLRNLADQIEERAQNLGDSDLGNLLEQFQGVSTEDLQGALDDLRDAGIEIPTVETP